MDRRAFSEQVRRAPRLAHKDRAILERCAGKTVLDVGCAGQDVRPDDPGWLHGRIASVAASLRGVDVDKASVDLLRDRGWAVHLPDELAGSGERYDVVVMADVLEHVDDPVAFLRTYASFLRVPDGVVVVTTPNPFAARQFLRVLAGDRIAVNPEHTFWLDPMTLFEVAARAGLEVREIAWLADPGRTRGAGATAVLERTAAVLGRWRRYFSPNFLCVVGTRS